MKTYLTYGASMAIAGAVFQLLLFFLGLHSDVNKLSLSQWVGGLGLLAIGVTCLVLGMRARRAELPPGENFGYGRALGTGVMICLISSVIGIGTNFLYFQVINPGFGDLIVQGQLAAMEAKGMSGQQLEQAEKGVRFFMQPAAQAVFGFIIGMFWGTIISLVVAAFVKRPADAAVAA